MAKEFFEFKLIEIDSDTTVKEHMSFVHCVQPGYVQFMYFSEDLKYLYERQKFESHFLYERVNIGQETATNEVMWKPIHRFKKLPFELLNLTDYPYIFSPSFKRYIDLDDTRTKFLIMNSETEKPASEIPEDLMSGKDEPIKDVVRRFRWLSDNLIHIISIDGIEKIVDITDNYREVSYNVIPLYDKTICTR